VGIRPVGQVPRRRQNLHQPVRTLLGYASFESLSLKIENLSSFVWNVPSTPQPLEQQRFLAVPERKTTRISSKEYRNTE
ncbi:hypothetical protein AVEN_175219-1, partial [Araneus ventricosus]